MKLLNVALAALSVAILSSPLLVSVASAHPVGERCYYQRIDAQGNVRNRYDRCHHLPSRYRDQGRSGFSLYFDLGNGWYYGNRPRRSGNAAGQDGVCLVTFFNRNQVQAGADANVQRARYLPRRQAQRMDGPNDRNRIFDYGTNRQTRETCRMLNNINN